ncbi:MAG: DmsE family decaheme c-type cytochrome [Gammaproteobacteria bacterium]
MTKGMGIQRSLTTTLFCLTLLVFPGAGAEQPTSSTQAGNYTDTGADTCLQCHGEGSGFEVVDIFKTKHGQPADGRTPFAGLQCESCHGPGGSHIMGEAEPPIMEFEGGDSAYSIEEQNKVCLGCHENQSRIAWKGGPHGGGDVACSDCHQIHAAQDRVLTAKGQGDVCFNCHQKQRGEFQKTSHHPVRFGLMTCTDCHKPHGSVAPALLAKPTLNQTCYTCHAEKRGPLLWEHAPVAEDCSLCHNPHGSIHPALLTKRPPLLCQQCHSARGHPSLAYTKEGLPSGSPSGFLLSGSCLNCHSQVHGSNHPSGVKLMR